MNRAELAKMMDVTLVRNIHSEQEIEDLISAAKQYKFACVFTMQCYIEKVAAGLSDVRDTHIGGVIGFPSGTEFTRIKLEEARINMLYGADEIDMVINLSWLRSRKYNEIQDEIKMVKDAILDKPLKCIIEISCINESEAAKACELVVRAGADYVKTGTGWFGGATVEQVRFIKSIIGNSAAIKAAGGIRTLQTAEALIEAGASRLGVGLESVSNILG